MTTVAVHRCRFVDFVPSAINCIVFEAPAQPHSVRMAVARANADIEIWNVANGFHLETFIPGGEGQSVEALVWINGRLFTAGLFANIIEWDLASLTPRRREDSFGGPVWSMVSNTAGTKLAIGCEDGVVRIFDILEDGIALSASLDAQSGARILSLCWTTDVLVTGSADSTVCVWNTETSRCLQRINVQSKGGTDAALVWAVRALPDNTVVTADSKGRVQFWNTQFGTLRDSFRSHSADVLALAYDVVSKSVFASGIDNNVVQFRCSEAKRQKWVVAARRRHHTHDVRAMAISPTRQIITGGVDTTLIVTNAADFGLHRAGHRKIPPFPHRQFIDVAAGSHLLMAQHANRLDFWHLNQAEQLLGHAVADLPPRRAACRPSAPRPLLRLKPKTGHNIRCSAMAASGSAVAMSSLAGISVFTLALEGELLDVSRVRGLPDMLPALAMQFTPTGERLVCLSSDLTVSVLSLADNSVSRIDLPQDTTCRRTSSSLLAISGDGQWLAISHGGAADVVHLDSLKHHCTLPEPTHQPTCMAFRPHSDHLFLVDVRNHVYSYDVGKKRFSSWMSKAADRLPKSWLNRKEVVVGISFSPRNPDTMLLQDHAGFVVVDLAKAMPDVSKAVFARDKSGGRQRTAASRKRKNSQGDDTQQESSSRGLSDDVDNTNFRGIQKYQPLLFAGFCGDDELVVIEKPWVSIIQALPAPLHRPKFAS